MGGIYDVIKSAGRAWTIRPGSMIDGAPCGTQNANKVRTQNCDGCGAKKDANRQQDCVFRGGQGTLVIKESARDGQSSQAQLPHNAYTASFMPLRAHWKCQGTSILRIEIA